MSTELFNGVKIYTTGEKLPAEDINALSENLLRSAFRVGLAGENITKNQACYVKASDGKVYKADADDVSILVADAIMFALETVTTGNMVDCQVAGVVEQMAGLTIGAKYYLSGTAGGIATTPNATRTIEVGIAVSANHLLIRRQKNLGAWVTRASGTAASPTTFQAETDLFLVVDGALVPDGNNAAVYTDSANPPTTLRGTAYSNAAGADHASFCTPVKKDDYYKVLMSSGGSMNFYTIPLH